MFSRIFGKKPKQEAPAAPPDLSSEGLAALFGKDGVRETTNLVLTQVPNLVDAASKFGGLPGFLEKTAWPHCASCRDPMMFVGQVGMGPEQPLKYPRDAIMYIFLCQSDPTDQPECETWTAESGCSSVFAQEGVAERMTPQAPFLAASDISGLVAASCATPDKVHTMWPRLNQRGNKEYRATLFGQYECRPRTELSVCDQPLEGIEWTDAHYAVIAALGKNRRVFIGGFPDWVQGPGAPRCKCEKDMEFVLQFTAFDEAINLGDAGEAYVFACPDRCSPTSFALDWQCC